MHSILNIIKSHLVLTTAIVFGVIALIVACFNFFATSATINVSVNNVQLSIHGSKTLELAIKKSGLPVNPGDLIGINGEVIKRDEGYPFYATVNGKEIDDAYYVLSDGDTIRLSDGKDKVEDTLVEEETVPFKCTIGGKGSVCMLSGGADGILGHLTGKITGEKITKYLKDPEPLKATWKKYDVGQDKVLALTFDGGPSSTYTEKILDILEENDAVATFFIKGSQSEDYRDLLEKVRDQGNQIASNTYTCTMTYNSTAEKVEEEIRYGLESIKTIFGNDYSQSLIRFPDALFNRDIGLIAGKYVDTVIGWDLQTGDNLGTSTDQIIDTLLQAKPGDIIEMHDGGTSLDNTIEALEHALPILKEQGYSFITIDSLLQYPS